MFYLLRKVPIITGRDLRSAKQGPDQYGQPAVHFSLKADAATRFGKATRENINRRLAIVLDRTVVSAPNIENAICGSKGRFPARSRCRKPRTWR